MFVLCNVAVKTYRLFQITGSVEKSLKHCFCNIGVLCHVFYFVLLEIRVSQF